MYNANGVQCRWHQLFTSHACVVAPVPGGQRQNAGRFTHMNDETKTYLLPHLEESCVGGCAVAASGKSRSTRRLVHSAVFSLPPCDLNDRRRHPSFQLVSHLAALNLRHVHIWMQVQRLHNI